MKRRVELILATVVVLTGGAVLAYSVLALRVPEPPVPADLALADRAFAERVQRVVEDVRLEPRDPEGWLTLGMVYEAHQLMQLAQQCYSTSVELGGGARSMYHLAVVRGRTGDVPGAIQAMRETIALDDSHGPAHWRLGFWLLDENSLDEAESAFRKAMTHRIGPFDLAGDVGMARVHIQRGELDRAQAILEPLVATPSPYAAFASHLLGTVLARKEQPEAARAALARGRAAEPVFADPLHEKINEYRTDPEWIVTHAKGLVARGEFDRAIPLLEAASGARPDDALIQNNLAIALIGAKRFDEAQGLLEAVTRNSPASYQGHFNLALAAHAQATLSDERDAAALRAEARVHLEEALRLNPSFGGALGLQADMMSEQGEHDVAMQLYFRAIAVEPASAMWWRGAALSAARCGRFEEAQRCIEQLQALRPGDPQVASVTSEVQSLRSDVASDRATRTPSRSQDVGP